MVGDAQDGKSRGAKELVTKDVTGRRWEMICAVGFDNEARRFTEEVEE